MSETSEAPEKTGDQHAAELPSVEWLATNAVQFYLHGGEAIDDYVRLCIREDHKPPNKRMEKRCARQEAAAELALELWDKAGEYRDHIAEIYKNL